MADISRYGYNLIKRSPGLILVMVGFMAIYITVGFGRIGADGKETPLPVYLAIGFGFLSFLSGVVLLVLELRNSATSMADDELPVTGDLEHAVGQLSKNYEILRKQATQGFVLAGFFMALGICVILAGAVGEMFGLTAQAGHLTTVAGIVVEAVSGIGLYLFKQTFQRINVTSDRLHDTWKILTAFRKAETLPDDKRAEVICKLIDRLVETGDSRR